MNSWRTFVMIMLFVFVFPVTSRGQGYISTDYLSYSTFRDELGNKYGSGNLMTISGKYTLPISIKQDSDGKMKVWSATLNCKYGKLDNPKNVIRVQTVYGKPKSSIVSQIPLNAFLMFSDLAK